MIYVYDVLDGLTLAGGVCLVTSANPLLVLLGVAMVVLSQVKIR